MKEKDIKEFDGKPIAIQCPIEGCFESYIIPYLPITYRLRCMMTNEPLDILIETNGEISVLYKRSNKTIKKEG